MPTLRWVFFGLRPARAYGGAAAAHMTAPCGNLKILNIISYI